MLKNQKRKSLRKLKQKKRNEKMEKIEPKKKIKDFGENLIKQAEKGENPNMTVPIRALSNVFYDTKSKMLKMGDKASKRFFFNVAHVRKFVQTLEVASAARE